MLTVSSALEVKDGKLTAFPVQKVKEGELTAFLALGVTKVSRPYILHER